MPGAFIETEKLRTRMLEFDDVDALAALYASEEVVRFVPQGHRPVSEAIEDIRRIRLHWLAYGFGVWALVSKETGLFVGRAGFARMESGTDVHYGCVLDPTLWRGGVATELMREALCHAFEFLRVPKVFALTHVDNGAAQRVLVKLGLEREADGEYFGHVQAMFQIGRRVWESK